MVSAVKHILCFILIYKLSCVLSEPHNLSIASRQITAGDSTNSTKSRDYHSIINNAPSTDHMSFNGRAMWVTFLLSNHLSHSLLMSQILLKLFATKNIWNTCDTWDTCPELIKSNGSFPYNDMVYLNKTIEKLRKLKDCEA